MNYELEDQYIKLQLQKFSEYRKDFLKEIEHDEIAIVLLKTHLYIEQEMRELTDIFFKRPERFKSYNFKSRLNLLYGLGIIDKELFDPISSLNTIRNSIGHKLKFVYSEEDYQKLYDSLSSNLLIEFKKDLSTRSAFKDELNYHEKTKLLLACIWTNIKAHVLSSFKYKQKLAEDFERQAKEELEEFKNNRS